MRQGWGRSSQSPAFQPVGLWTPSTLRAAPPAPHRRVHTPPLAAAAAELISTTSTYRSWAGCQAGRHRARGGGGAPGGQGTAVGEGAPLPPFLRLHLGHRAERRPRSGSGGMTAWPARGGRRCGAESKGPPPPLPHPLLLIKAENKEAAREGGFDLTPPSPFQAGTAQTALGRRDAWIPETQVPCNPGAALLGAPAAWAVLQVGGLSGRPPLLSTGSQQGRWERVPSSTAAAGAHTTLPRGVPTEAWQGRRGHSWHGGQAEPSREQRLQGVPP